MNTNSNSKNLVIKLPKDNQNKIYYSNSERIKTKIPKSATNTSQKETEEFPDEETYEEGNSLFNFEEDENEIIDEYDDLNEIVKKINFFSHKKNLDFLTEARETSEGFINFSKNYDYIFNEKFQPIEMLKYYKNTC